MVGQSSHDVLRGYRLHVTNLEPQAFFYSVRFWVTPPSAEPRWAAPLNQFFSMFGNAGVTQELFRRQGSVYVAGMTFAIEPQQTVSVGIGPHILKQPGRLRSLEERALAAAADGCLVPLVDRFALAKASEAHQALETRATTGKTVLVP